MDAHGIDLQVLSPSDPESRPDVDPGAARDNAASPTTPSSNRQVERGPVIKSADQDRSCHFHRLMRDGSWLRSCTGWAPLDLTALAAGVVEDAQVIYPDRDIALTADGPAQVTGDAARLQQVLRNLVGNAVQHTPAQTAVRVTVTTPPGHVQVEVADDGPGIAPQDLPRVFERFWRAEASRSRSYGGSGLGLAIVEAIIHAHHGQVSVESAVGVGTTVTVRLNAPRA
jgi:signal transduction histidine kinase